MALPLMPVGSDFASGRCVAKMALMPAARPTDQVLGDGGQLLGVGGVLKLPMAYIAPDDDGMQSRDRLPADSGVILFSGHRSRGNFWITFVRRRSSPANARMSSTAYSMSSRSSPARCAWATGS